MASMTLKEKLDKIQSPNLQSQKQTAVVLEGIETAFKERNTTASSTAYFAALLSLLDNKTLVTPVVYLLDVVTPFTPEPLLRAKFTQILTLLAPVLTQPDADAPLIKSSIGCLESLLLAQDATAWEMSTAQVGPRRAVGGLLSIALDPRPKVRKRAQEALKKILKNPPPSPSIDHPASPMCAETCMQSLKLLAEKASQSQKEKKAEPTQNPELIHALQLTKAVAAASGGWPSKKIESLCELLLGIARSGNEHMSMAVFDIFEMIFEGMATDEVASAKLPRLVEIIRELRPSPNDTQLLPPWIAILSRAYDVSAQVSPAETFQELVEPFVMVAGYLESEAKNIRISASECLVSFMANCVPQQVLLEPTIYDEKVIKQLVKTMENLLTAKYQAAWMESCNVLGAMYDALRWRASPYLLGVTKNIGDMRGNDSFTGKAEADGVLGKAIRAMGPEAVLGVLPLNLAKPVRGEPGRAWLLPLLRDYVSNTNLAHFRSELAPLSAAMFQRVLDHGEAEKTMEIKIYETVVHQIWSILPGYCDLPLDLEEAFDTTFAEMLSNLLYEQIDLRLDICRALKAVVESNQAIADTPEDDDLVLQSRITKEAAKKNLEYLGNTFAADFLSVLFNVYSTTLPQKRGPVLQTINAFLSIIPSERLTETFDVVCEKLAAALEDVPEKGAKDKNKNQEQLPSTAHTLMDLVVTMSIYLPKHSFDPLSKIASLVIFRDDDPQLQKKAYKLIPRLADSELGKATLEQNHEQLQALFLSSAEKVSAPARRDRLVAIASLMPFIPNTALHFIPAVLSEVVISCKEQNEKARTAAFDLLVMMGHKLAASEGALIDNSKVANMPADAPMVSASLEEYFTMVSAGLAGSTPHMISASITAITRILYEFRGSLSTETMADLVQTMDLFLTSNNREIVKSVLGFVKVCVISLPVELMLPRLATMIPNVMVWSHEHKGHFRSKVKHILERMARRYGFEVVTKHCPEADRKLITNIRKAKERSKRRKEAAKDGDESDGGEGQEPTKRVGRFESEYDQALYSSGESDHSDNSDGEDAPKGKKGARKGGNAYIVEDENEPLDLLDRNALANISSTKPVKAKRPNKTKAKTDLDGKLILGKDDDEEAMDIDAPQGGEDDTGVGAYVNALKGKDAPRRGLRGKLKWSNRKGNDDDDDEGGDGMDVDEGVTQAFKARGGFRGRGDSRSRGPSEGRGGRGGSGGRGRSGRGGRGGIQAGRRPLGQDKQHGPTMRGGVAKGGRGRK